MKEILDVTDAHLFAKLSNFLESVVKWLQILRKERESRIEHGHRDCHISN